MKTGYKIISALCLLLVPLNTLHPKETTKDIYLAPGEQEIIDYSSLTSIAMGNRNIVDFKFPKNRKSIVLVAKQQGITSLTLWGDAATQNYRITVIPLALKSIYLELCRALSNIEGIKVRVLGDKVLIEGAVFKPQDKSKISGLAKSSERIVDLVRIDTEMIPMLAKLIKEELTANGYPQIRVKARGEKIFLEGDVYRKEDLEGVLEISKALFPNINHSVKLALTGEKMILVDLKITEIKRDADKLLGIKWQNSLTFNTNFSKGGAGQAGSLGTISLGEGYSATLNMLEARGLMKILSNPKLVCKNGRKGKFQAGGEIPIRLVGERTTDLIFKNYGLILEITPEADDSDNISVEINAEISDIDSSTSIEGVPGFLKNSFDTSVNIAAGETIILAGLISNKSGKSVEKLPFLGHLPLLGELFKSRNFRNSRSQFAVFITPALIKSSSENNRDMIIRTDKALREADGQLKPKIMD